MPKMKKDEVVRASLMRDGVVRSANTEPMPMHIRTTDRAASQAAAIAARKAEFAKAGKGSTK